MKGKIAKILGVGLVLGLVLSLSLVPAVPVMAQPTPDTDDGIEIEDVSGTALYSIPATGSFYVWVRDDGVDIDIAWNTDMFTQETGQVKLEVIDGVGNTESTHYFTATELDNDDELFRTGAISVASLGVKPGYKLTASISGTSLTDDAYVQAEISFGKSLYSIDESMTVTLEDDQLNTDAASVETLTGVIYIDKKDVTAIGTALNLVETGKDTGVFQVTVTPNAADTADDNIWCGDAMMIIYEDPDDDLVPADGDGTTGGSSNDDYPENLATVGADNDNEITAIAYVSATSPSSVSFSPGTIDPTATSVDVVVIDRDESSDTTDNNETISSAVVVESLAADDSVIDSLIVATLTEEPVGGQFEATVTFGTGATQLDVTGAAKLQATYTDPNDLEDTSTVTAAVGTTVDLYDDTGALDSSYTTIQAAINAAPAPATGWTVKVSEAYNSADETFPINVNKVGLTVESIAGAASTTIDAATETIAVQITADNVVFDGFTVVTAATPSMDIIKLTGADGVTVRNNIVTSTVINGIGIQIFNDVTKATVSGNQLENCTMYLDDDGGATLIEDCTISDNTITEGAITLDDHVDGITISGNTISGCADIGAIQVLGLWATPGATRNDILVEGNTLSGNEQNGIWIQTDAVGTVTNLRVVGNNITDNTESGILIDDWDATSDAIKFNNISGNTDYGIKNTTTTNVGASHNWWGTVDGSEIADIVNDTSTGVTTYDPWLGASVSVAKFVTNATSLNAKTTVGVQVSGVDNSSNTAEIGAALYTSTPKATPTFSVLDDGFLDVYVVPDAIATTDEIILKFSPKFSPAGINENSVVYAWNELYGEWMECTLQDYSSYGGYIWVKVHSELADVVTVPTIEALEGLPFAISGEAAPPDPWDYDTDEDGEISKAEALNAIVDYFDGVITKDLALQVIALYFAS